MGNACLLSSLPLQINELLSHLYMESAHPLSHLSLSQLDPTQLHATAGTLDATAHTARHGHPPDTPVSSAHSPIGTPDPFFPSLNYGVPSNPTTARASPRYPPTAIETGAPHVRHSHID